ncbi:hypothetical protein [Candidatus Williamhamiltonella defendens]
MCAVEVGIDKIDLSRITN